MLNKNNIVIPDGVTNVYFDVFDTIIYRTIHPEYVKKLFCKTLIQSLRLTEKPDKLYKLRNKLETELCEANKLRGYDLEFSFEDMASDLFEALVKGNKILTTISRIEFIDICCATELQTELSVQQVDTDCLGVVDTLHDRKYKLACISDIYLPMKIVQKMFEYHKIDHYFDKIYISSEYKITKRSGRLYDLVLKDQKIAPTNSIMIGDNEESDYNVPITKGMNAILLDRNARKKHYSDNWTYSHDTNAIYSRISSVLNENADTEKCTIFTEMALTLFLFTKKIHERAVSANANEIFFLSREGEFLIKLFNIYLEHQLHHDSVNITPHYLIVSRRSTYLPSLDDIVNESFSKLFRQYRSISLYEFLASLNFERDCINHIAEELNADPEAVIDDFPESQLYLALRSNSTFKATFELLRKKQRENLIKYVEGFGADIREHGLYLVDIGWKGTIQDNLFDVFGRDLSIHGFYLGYIDIFGSNGKYGGNTKEGILFSMAPDKSPYYHAYADNTALFEVILGASHGSAVSYEDDGDGIRVVTQDEPGEMAIYNEKVRHIQDSIENKFRLLCAIDSMLHHDASYLERFTAKTHSRLVFFPTQAEMDYFRGLYHYENFGYFRVSKFDENYDGNTIRNLVSLILNPNKTLNRGWWIPLTLSSLGLGFLRYVYGVCRYLQNFVVADR